MKPYFAILYDSFLESVSSKVLWILLIAWTLILAAIFPLSLSQGESYVFNGTNIKSPKTILDQLAAASAGKGTRKQKAVFAKLDQEFQRNLKDRQANQTRISVGKLIDSLNKLLLVKGLYDKEVWPTADKRSELKDVVENENRSAVELERLNRGLIDLAFEGSIESSSGQASWVTYGGIKLGSALPLSINQAKPFIETMIFPLVMRLGLGIGAMFVAIIITSPMIPDMFQPGSLHLLLSKPISRSFLFLTKFVGGCTFVAFNIVYLLIGLYLYAGIRLDIWNRGILLCIPLFIFMFMIFYSVSALVGLIWKNPIICVVVTAMFWALCLGVGWIHFFFDLNLNLQNQTQRIYSVGDTTMIGTQQGRLQFWDDESKQWKIAFGERNGQKILGPVWVPNDSAIYFGRSRQMPFGFRSGENTGLEICRAPDLKDPNDTTFKTKIWDDGRLDSGAELPPESQQFFKWKNTFGVFTQDGLYAYDAETAAKAEQQKSMLGGFGFGIAKTVLPAYKLLTPKNWDLTRPMDIGVAPSMEHVITYSRGKLKHWTIQNDMLEEVGKGSLEIPAETVAILGTNDRTCIVCPIGIAPFVIDVDTLQVRKRLDDVGEASFREIKVDSKGRFVLLTTEGTLWEVDADGEECTKPSVTGQGKALAIHFNESDQLWISHSGKRADLVDLDSQKSLLSRNPKLGIAESIFAYVVNPFYQVNPKPAAVNETIEYVLKNPKNKTLAIDRNDLDVPKVVSDPWTPIWSNLAFVIVMLTVSCWYLYRQDL